MKWSEKKCGKKFKLVEIEELWKEGKSKKLGKDDGGSVRAQNVAGGFE